MKSYLLKILLLASFLVVFAGITVNVEAVSIENPLKANTFTELLDDIINFIYTISFPIAAIMIIVSGFYFITAMGDPVKVSTARKIVLWTLIGLLVIISAKGLIKLLKSVFFKSTP